MTRPTLNTDYLERQTKWNAGHFRIEVEQLKPSIPTTEFLIEPHTYNDGEFDVRVVVDPSQYNGGASRMQNTLTTLVENAGIEGLEIERSAHGDTFSVQLRTTDPTDLTRITKALTQDIELSGGETVYGIIKPEVSHSVADQLSKVIDGLEVDDLEDGVKSVPYLTDLESCETQLIIAGYAEDPEGQRDYLTVHSAIPHTSIESIGREGQHVENKDGNAAVLEVTELSFAPDVRASISTALQAGGFKSGISDTHATVEAPLKDVAQALHDRGLLGHGLNNAIQEQVTDLKGAFITSAEVATREEVVRHDAARKLQNIVTPA